jgi:uncharacterized protein YhdP
VAPEGAAPDRAPAAPRDPEAPRGRAGAAREPGPAALDVVAERFDFRGRELGKLELKADYAGEEWRIAKLDITNAHAQWRSSGAWRRTGAGALTTLAVKLDADSLNALMASSATATT